MFCSVSSSRLPATTADAPPQRPERPGRGASGSPLPPAAPRRSRLASPEQRTPPCPAGARTAAPPRRSRRRAASRDTSGSRLSTGCHLGGAEGQGAGLVKGHLGDGGQPLQGVALPHQKAVPGGVADGGHDGGGSGQHQGAGAEYHQNGHRPDDLPGDQPGQGGGGQGDDHDPGGPAVGQPHDLGLAGVGGLDQPDHPLDGAVLPHLGRPHLKGAELVHRAAGNLVPAAPCPPAGTRRSSPPG